MTSKVTIATVALFLSSAAGARSALADEYLVTDLTELTEWGNSTVLGHDGEIGGNYYASPDPWDDTIHGFLYRDGAKTDIYTTGLPPYNWPPDSIDVNGLNAFDTAVGRYRIGWAGRAFMKSKTGAMVDLGALPPHGDWSQAQDVNNWGAIVGGAEIDAFIYRAFLYTGGAMKAFGTFGGLNSYANAINDRGQVTGWAENVYHQQRAFRFTGAGTSGTMVDLGTLGGANSSGEDINASGVVVGNSQIGNTWQAFLHDGTRMINLGALLGASRSLGASIAGGLVVGDYWVADVERRSFLYRVEDGTMTDLDDLVPPGIHVFEARDVNSSGQILVRALVDGVGHRDLLLTPRLLERFAYAYADQPNVTQYEPDARFSYSASGGRIVIRRVATGTYEVWFFDLPGWTDELASTISVSTHGASATCSYLGVTGGYSSISVVTVGCADVVTRTSVDARFLIMLVGDRSIDGPSAFLRTDGAGSFIESFTWGAGRYAPSIARVGTGTYDVVLGTGNTPKSVKLVTAGASSAGSICVNAKGISGGVQVKCYDAGGALADRHFSVVQVAGGRAGRRLGFARATLPTTPSYTVSPQTSFNSSGGAITVTRSGVGRYTVRFAGLATPPGGGEHIQVTPFWDAPTICNSTSWLGDGADLLVGVECRRGAGQPVDARFDVLAIE